MIETLKGFAPWILYSIFYGSRPDQFYLAIIITLIASVVLNFREYKEGFILTWVTLVYFALLLILTAGFKIHWLQTHVWIISHLVLTGMAFGSFIIKKPFTYQYAKHIVPKERWGNPLFIQINNILTNIWGCIFLATAIFNYIHLKDPQMNQTLYMVLTNIGWVIGIVVSKRFPRIWVKHKTQKNIR